MLRLPEYLEFAEPDPPEGAVTVTVRIDGRKSKIRRQRMSLERLEDFLCDARGAMPFLAFDEHPKCFVALTLDLAAGTALLDVRSLTDQDAFLTEWETRGPNAAIFVPERRSQAAEE